jgi:chromosome segregation ATPase
MDPGEGRSEDSKARQRVTEGTVGRQRTLVDQQRSEISKYKTLWERYSRKYRAARDHTAQLQYKIEEDSKSFQEAWKQQDRRIRELEAELTRTKELLDARSKELSGAQSFLSTADRLSEAEVLGIVRDLNENIFQVAAKLTEEWEKFRPDRSSRFKITREVITAFSESFGPALVHHVLDREPAAVTFLIQSCLCDFAAHAASGRGYKRHSKTLSTVYERLSASG